jgi:transcription termination factor NusA
MQDAIRELQQIKGIGAVLAQRLVEAGIDNLERLAAVSDEELAAIKGVIADKIPTLKEQARRHLQTGSAQASLQQMLEDAERLREGMQDLVIKLRDQHVESDDGKTQRNLRKEIARVLATLERVEAALSDQLRRISKKLAKADAKLAEIAKDDVEALTKGLRDTRKTIDKIVRS